jgi:hypothetical protein
MVVRTSPASARAWIGSSLSAIAPDEDILLEHARCGGFPADRISKVSTIIDPSTGD